MDITELVELCHQAAVEKGWWDDNNKTLPEQIALMHSELSEALEEYRLGHSPTEIYRVVTDGVASEKPEGIPIELADLLIRIFDTAGHYGINLEDAIVKKMLYNQTRPHRHGGKLL